MGNKKKLLFQVLFLILVAGITAYLLFQGKDIETILNCIGTANPLYIGLSFICVFFFIGGEATIIYLMLRSWGEKIPARRCYLYSCAGFFFSCITPSATGGQPAQIYFMKKDKIPIPVSTVILLVITIVYKFVLVVLGVAVLVFKPVKIIQYLEPVMFWCYLGLALNVFCVVFMCILVFHPSLLKNILFFFMDRLERIHLLKRKEKRRQKLENAMNLYQETAAYLVKHRSVVGASVLITFLQRFTLFMVTGLTYFAFGLRGEAFFNLMVLQGMISMAVDMLPLPGGMGISEKLFLSIFLPIFGVELTFPAMLVSRGISYYGQLLVSAVLTAYAGFKIGRK